MRAPVTPRSTPRDQYEERELKVAPAGSPVLAWNQAGRQALRERLGVRPSFRELVYFDSAAPTAVGYRLQLRRGQRITLAYRVVEGRSGELFADVFEEVQPPSAMFRHLFSANPDSARFEFEAASDGEYVIRLQPVLNWRGLREVILTSEAGLWFPVKDSTLRAVRSWFGDARDGGARDHEGVDIFAPRGTTVVAVADGVIESVGNTSIGGRVVWQRDPQRNLSYYYAHLTQQHVTRGQTVRAGDRIGTVGNTGNARATRPHLHFAIYRPIRVAIDPVPFLYDQAFDSVGAVTAARTALGRWTRIAGDDVWLRFAPALGAGPVARLPKNSRVRLIGGIRDWNRVVLEDGTTGFLPSWQVAQQ